MAEPAQVRKLTVEEYLDLERRSEVRHEYVGGLIFAMAGESRASNRIGGNIYRALQQHLRGSRCEAYVGGVKTRIRQLNIFYYPDVVVTCDPADDDRYVVERPVLIIEVLSPTTEGIDRREKRFNYAQLASLQEYVLVSQDAQRVEVLRRDAEWLPQIVEGDGIAPFRSVGLDLALKAIYEGVELDRAG